MLCHLMRMKTKRTAGRRTQVKNLRNPPKFRENFAAVPQSSRFLYLTTSFRIFQERRTKSLLFQRFCRALDRLERIQKLADVDYEDARERLVLQLSFQILEQRIV